MKVYVWLMSRPCDNGAVWPMVYQDHERAEKAFGRVSDVVEVEVEMYPADFETAKIKLVNNFPKPNKEDKDGKG